MRRWILPIACFLAATQASAQTPMGAVPDGVKCIAERAGASLSKAAGEMVESRNTDFPFDMWLPHLLICSQKFKWEYRPQRQSAMDFARSLGLISYFGDRLRALKLSPASIVQLHDRLPPDLRFVVGSAPLYSQPSELATGRLEEFVKANSEAKTQPALGYAAAILRAEIQRRDAIASYVRISEQIRTQNAAPAARP